MRKRQMQMVVLLVAFLIASGCCLQCYKCYDTTKACNSGNKDYLGILNCTSPSDVCATFQYETNELSMVYTTTIRGCQLLREEGICNELMKTITSKISKNTVKKGIFCKTCNTDLCNSSRTIYFQISMLLLILITPILM